MVRRHYPLRAERRAGEMLAEMPKHPAGRPAVNRSHDVTVLPPTYQDLGIEKMQASRVVVLRRIGELLGAAKRGAPIGNQHANNSKLPDSNFVFTPTEKKRRHSARLLAEYGDDHGNQYRSGKLLSGNLPLTKPEKQRRHREAPVMSRGSCVETRPELTASLTATGTAKPV